MVDFHVYSSIKDLLLAEKMLLVYRFYEGRSPMN